MIAAVVYLLCALTSIGCAALLFRGYRRSRSRLLLWSFLCFIGLALNNIFLFIDQEVLVHVDLRLARVVPALIGMSLLVYSLIWDSRS
ncbi:MAG TPA: DUF5985 family protein [Polyangia bacterium]|jgi:hypothetical protein|nr:DUF5985 family protein [Polyangia bacterium]